MQCGHKQNETITQPDAKVILINKDLGCAIQIVITPALEGITQNCMGTSRAHISIWAQENPDTCKGEALA